MNFNNYRKWLEKQRILNLPDNSVIVMDNASYHNMLGVKHPNSNTKKEDVHKWLNERGIVYDTAFTKPELYHLIQMHKPIYQQYPIDAIFAQHGHTVCRLPPYHPELNPIEKLWALVKNWVATRNITFKVGDVEQLTKRNSATLKHMNGQIYVDMSFKLKKNILWTTSASNLLLMSTMSRLMTTLLFFQMMTNELQFSLFLCNCTSNIHSPIVYSTVLTILNKNMICLLKFLYYFT